MFKIPVQPDKCPFPQYALCYVTETKATTSDHVDIGCSFEVLTCYATNRCFNVEHQTVFQIHCTYGRSHIMSSIPGMMMLCDELTIFLKLTSISRLIVIRSHSRFQCLYTVGLDTKNNFNTSFWSTRQTVDK